MYVCVHAYVCIYTRIYVYYIHKKPAYVCAYLRAYSKCTPRFKCKGIKGTTRRLTARLVVLVAAVKLARDAAVPRIRLQHNLQQRKSSRNPVCTTQSRRTQADSCSQARGTVYALLVSIVHDSVVEEDAGADGAGMHPSSCRFRSRQCCVFHDQGALILLCCAMACTNGLLKNVSRQVNGCAYPAMLYACSLTTSAFVPSTALTCVTADCRSQNKELGSMGFYSYVPWQVECHDKYSVLMLSLAGAQSCAVCILVHCHAQIHVQYAC
jgi:hypothetical protein